MSMFRSVLAAMLLTLATLGVAHAVKPDEVLADRAMEQRARDISAGLRCLVCQNQSIDDSDAPLARDLRVLVRDRLKAGDSNEQVYAFVVQRYGEFVLLKPPFGLHTLILWVGPFVVLGLGIMALLRFRRRLSATHVGTRLSEAEQAELEKVLGKG